MPAVGEVVLGVVDDMGGTQGSHQVEFGGAAHARDLRPERPGQLHGVAADTARRAGDQHLLPCLDAAGIGQGLQGRERGHRNHRGLLEGGVRRLAGELVLAGRGVLGEGAPAEPEHLITWREPGHRRADRDDRAGHIEPLHRIPRTADTANEAEQVRPARHHVPPAPVQTCRVHSKEHLAAGDLRPGNPRETQHVGGAVGVLHDRPHRALCRPRQGRLVAGRRVQPFRSHDRFLSNRRRAIALWCVREELAVVHVCLLVR